MRVLKKKITYFRMPEKNIQNILQKTFKLQEFREGQQEIIQSVIDGNDTLVYMPTG